MPLPSDRARAAAAAIIVAGAALFVYREALDAYFFDDDFQWLVGTWSFRLSNLIDFAQLTHFYRPVIDVYFAAATPLFGGSPVLFHAASIALHVVNGLLLLSLAWMMSGRLAYGFLAALFFVVQPSDIDAVAWVGALAEPVSTFFGCLAMLALLRFRRAGSRPWQALSLAAFLLALLTHESAVMFVPLLMLADWTYASSSAPGERLASALALARRHAPYMLLLAVYLGVNVVVNSRNYVVTEGHYGVGPHVLTNALEYITALYVGRRDALNYAAIAVVLPLLLLRGGRDTRFATSWLLLGLLPFLFFTWGTTSRYLYLAAMGFGLLLAGMVLSLDRRLTAWLSPRWRIGVVAVLVAALTVRFMTFATENVRSFTERTLAYREYAAEFRQIHGDLPSHSRVAPDPRLRIDHEHRFVNALIQWEYRDPTIQLVPDAR